jgi:tRNA nucleotidyltransferase (CCA-adding enzyme)
LGGQQDIEHGVLRTVFDQAFEEDPLRVARALVAHARHGLEPDGKTRAQMAQHGPSISNVPAERVMEEIDKLMQSPNPASAIVLAHETGALKHILPEVDAAFGFDQNNPHHELELGHHLVQVLERTSAMTDDPDIRLAALLHDIGKPASAWVDPETGGNHYYQGPNGEGANHEEVGADMARAALNRLRFPGDRTSRITDLVRHHMWAPFTSPKGARKFLNRVGDHADDLLVLREADQGGKGHDPSGKVPDLSVQRGLMDQVRSAGEATQRSQLAIDGRDLIAIGIKPGPNMGSILDRLTEAVIDDPALNNREVLLQMAQQ